MKRILATAAAIALGAGPVAADGHSMVKIGVILGFTGPIESLAPHMASGAELAISEVSKSGKLLGGKKAESVRADSTCTDSAVATSAAERLVTADGVSGIMGADCSGVTGAVLANVARPNGMVMISPSATSPGLSTAEDDGLFFRTAPSDARQGDVMAEFLINDGVRRVAVTYTNNDYGKGLADAFAAAYGKLGGRITVSAAHEDDKADYSAEMAALAAAGGSRLVVIGYADTGGSKIVQAALDSGAFDTFHFPDGMVSASLTDRFGRDLDGSTGQYPSSDGPGSDAYARIVGGAWDPKSAYSPESYDAAALLLLAMQSAGSDDPARYKSHVTKVANAPGEKIMPGQLAKALDILAAGGDVDYVGASAVELIGPGESAGGYRTFDISGGKMIDR